MPEPEYHRNEWPLEMCKVKQAWSMRLPEHGDGKAMGEGVIIAHPDSGWTEHPELIKGGRYLYNNYKVSRNFLTTKPTDNYEYWDTPDDSLKWLIRFNNPEDKYAKDILDHWLLGGGLHPSHGTSTSSVIFSDEGHPNNSGAEFPNYRIPPNQFVTGVSPKARVIPLRVCRSVLLGIDTKYKINTIAALGKAIFHSIELNDFEVGVISISLGSILEHEKLTDALKKARQSGVIICAAAGQLPGYPGWGSKKPIIPGNSPHTICVAGCYEDLNKPKPIEGFYGPEVEITAPGWDLTVARSLSRSPNYVIDSREYTGEPVEGSSYSTAITAGACALWLAFHSRALLIKTYGRPFLLDVFRYCLANSSFKPPGWDNINRGSGILDVEALLKCPLPSVSTAELVARSNHWLETDWGNSVNWGRE